MVVAIASALYLGMASWGGIALYGRVFCKRFECLFFIVRCDMMPSTVPSTGMVHATGVSRGYARGFCCFLPAWRALELSIIVGYFHLSNGTDIRTRTARGACGIAQKGVLLWNLCPNTYYVPVYGMVLHAGHRFFVRLIQRRVIYYSG